MNAEWNNIEYIRNIDGFNPRTTTPCTESSYMCEWLGNAMIFPLTEWADVVMMLTYATNAIKS